MRTKQDWQDHQEKIKRCGTSFKVLKLKDEHIAAQDSGKKYYKIVPVLCKSQLCPRCRSLMATKIKRKLSAVLETGEWRHATLTTINDGTPTPEKLKAIIKNFAKFVRAMKKKNKNFKYFRALEISKSGMIHIHAIINTYIQQPDLSRLWYEISGSYIVWINKIKNNKKIVNYVCSYITKKDENEEHSKLLFEIRTRRFSSSGKLLSGIADSSIYEPFYYHDYPCGDISNFINNTLCFADVTPEDIEVSKHFPKNIYNSILSAVKQHAPRNDLPATITEHPLTKSYCA